MSSSDGRKQRKKKRRKTNRISPNEQPSKHNFMDYGDLELAENMMKKLNNVDRSNRGTEGVKMSTGDTVSVIQNVQKGVERFKELRRTRRQRIAAAKKEMKKLDPTKGIRGLDESMKDDPMKPNPRNKYVISYFSKLAQSSDPSEEIDLEYVDQMLASGACIHCMDRYGQTILHEVAREWEIDVAEFLIDRGADLNRADNYGRTPLHVAAAVDYPEMVQFLVANGAILEIETKDENQTPLHYAASNDACDSLRKLHKLGADINKRDYKGRTPLQVAAELDRSETAILLLELGANAADIDRSGLTAIVLMISKMPTVAAEALNHLHRMDRANRKQYYDIHLLEPAKEGDRESKSRTALQVVVEYNQLELIKHPVMLRLIDIKWKLYGRFGVIKQVIWNLFIILLWTTLAITMKSPIEYDFSLPRDVFQFTVMVVATLLTIIQIIIEIFEFLQSKKQFKKWQEWRIGEIKKDLKFCHPRWPQEANYLEQEINIIQEKSPSYFAEFWNYFDWFVYFLLMTVSICHITAWQINNMTLSNITIKIFAITIIFVWLRFMKVARAFRALGPFIVMFGHMLKDCGRFAFLYFEFYIPFICAFWMIFGGVENGVTGMASIDELAFSLFRITLVDDYDYEGMKEVDEFMANILLGCFLAISAVLCLNLFIALLSDTFVRVYDNAFSNAIMQQASIMQIIEEGLSSSKRHKMYNFIHTNCAPESLFYDDDMVLPEGNELKKVTFQIKDDLDQLREQYHGVEESCQQMVTAIRSDVKEMRDKQTNAVSDITSELHLVKQMVQQLLDRQVGSGGGSSQPPTTGYIPSSNGQFSSQQGRITQTTATRGQVAENGVVHSPRFARRHQSKLSEQLVSPRRGDINRALHSLLADEDNGLLNASLHHGRHLSPILPAPGRIGDQSLPTSGKERLELYRKERKKNLKKRKDQEDYLEQEQNQVSTLHHQPVFDVPRAHSPDALSYISDDNTPLLNKLRFTPAVIIPTPPTQEPPEPVGDDEPDITAEDQVDESQRSDQTPLPTEANDALPSTDEGTITKDGPHPMLETVEGLSLGSSTTSTCSSTDSDDTHSEVTGKRTQTASGSSIDV